MSSCYEVVLAGLLHDIGKFAQRAHSSSEGLSAETKGLESYICPRAGHYYTHRHVLYTAEFILQQSEFFPAGIDKEPLNRLAAWHHKPSQEEEELISRADRLSSGEREESPEEEGAAGSHGTFRQVRLRAITNEVGLQAPDPRVWSHELNPLSPKNAFPRHDFPTQQDLTAEYRALWEAFLPAWNNNRIADPWGYINRALSILEHYTWCIPSDTTAYPDISLFDHLKTTAAIAGCLYMAQHEGVVRENQPFLLVTGDLGGIQNYLFNIRMGAGGLARRLRARSLYIALVTENIAHYLLRQVGLPMTNCLLSAGGHFTLLLPNTSRTQELLCQARQKLAQWTQEYVGCQLQPHMACLAVSEEKLRDFGAVRERLAEKLEQEKAQPLWATLQNGEGEGWNEEAFVLPPLISGQEELCEACQRRAGTRRTLGTEEIFVCGRCWEDYEKGRALSQARYIVFTEEPGSLPFGSYRLVRATQDLPDNAYLIYDLQGDVSKAPADRPLMGKHLARHVPHTAEGDIVEFGELAQRAEGYAGLAYLKADVDNLGRIFRHGFQGPEQDRRSISRLTALSRVLDLFFAGYIQHLAETNFSDSLYTVYSGGDDLLLIGPWDKMFQFAARLREDFRRYTCGNASWTLSAGLVIVNPHTPVLIATEEAEEYLEGAKNTPGSEVLPWPLSSLLTASGASPRKDRLVAFGTSLPWAQVATALAQARDLLQWLRAEQLTTGQVWRLLMYANLYQEAQRTGNILCYRYAPMLVYDLRRNWEQKAPNAAIEWAQQLALRDSPNIPLLRFVCEYALYGARD